MTHSLGILIYSEVRFLLKPSCQPSPVCKDLQTIKEAVADTQPHHMYGVCISVWLFNVCTVYDSAPSPHHNHPGPNFKNFLRSLIIDA